MHTPLTCAVALTALGLAHAQLDDLQPGPNYPLADPIPGSDRSESVDFGDVDSDGDLDIVIGNGGDGGPQTNRIFINQGGLQGGTEGAFVDATSTLFATLTDSTTRDLDFGDIDGDGDLDLVEANRGTTVAGQVARILVNQGGAQGGTAGVFFDGSDAAWGALLTVPPGDQVFGGDQGPWRGWSCDCDFADLDDDGDLDLFASSYGPNINGSQPSRVFLNDGSGVFDEHAPWADAGADIAWHTLDVELVDLDGDFDLDLFASSRDSQSRVFVNNTHSPLPGATTLFTDTTGPSLVATGATVSGTSVYEVELGDFDGDHDFDVWALNYSGFNDRRLTNRGTEPGVPPEFDLEAAAFGDPNTDENEIDHLDFDGDGDLDTFAANFSGTNWLYANGLAQGVDGFHRTGTTSSGSLYPFTETPASDNGQTSRDADVGDLDGDGDTDILLANDAGQTNRLWFNELGVPDTHAPTFARVSSPPGVLSGTVVIHAAIRDNDALYNVSTSDVDLLVRVDGGPEQSVAMTASGSAVFRAALDLGAGVTSLEYRVRAVDAAGNVGVSDVFFAPSGWTDLGGGLAGVAGVPALSATGGLGASDVGSIDLTDAAPSSPLLLAFATPSDGVPFKGGTLLVAPDLMVVNVFTTSPTGTFSLAYTAPALPESDLTFNVQAVIADGAAVQGFALSNALRGAVP